MDPSAVSHVSSMIQPKNSLRRLRISIAKNSINFPLDVNAHILLIKLLPWHDILYSVHAGTKGRIGVGFLKSVASTTLRDLSW